MLFSKFSTCAFRSPARSGSIATRIPPSPIARLEDWKIAGLQDWKNREDWEDWMDYGIFAIVYHRLSTDYGILITHY